MFVSVPASQTVASSPMLAPLTSSKRIPSIDVLRGAIMALMALDHVRDFFTGPMVSPVDAAHTTLSLFLTRWITHYCAPGFFLLAGMGAYLSGARGATKTELSRFLLTRGLWLIILEFTVVSFAWTFSGSMVVSQVIFQLGLSMMVVAALVWIPNGMVAALSLLVIFGHNLLDGIRPEHFGHLAWAWRLAHVPGPLRQGPGVAIFYLYVAVPWFAVMALGYVLGTVMMLPAERRRRILFLIGLSASLVFIGLRGLGLYGNAQPGSGLIPSCDGTWVHYASFSRNLISFLNVEKYPPSLQYLLMTLGPELILLSWFDRFEFGSAVGRFGKKLAVFGRVPMFFYLIHLYLIHLSALLLGLILHQPVDWLLHGGIMRGPDPHYGCSLAACYMFWLTIVGLLYFPCAWFCRLKQCSGRWWLRYL